DNCHEVTFDPSSGTVNTAGAKSIDSGQELNGVSCPSVTQCTAIDDNGDEVTFDSSSGTVNTAGVYRIDPGPYATVHSVSCPSSTQCTAIDGSGDEVTFDPSSGTVNTAGIKSLDPGPYATVHSVSCPSSTQCTATDGSGDEVTFDPSRGAVTTAGARRIDPGQSLNAVSCPSATECTAIDGHGHEVTFDPSRGTVNAAGVKSIDPGQYRYLNAVSCPSSTQCTATDNRGHEVTFDPSRGTVNTAGVKSIEPGDSLNAVSCPSSTQCTAIDDNGNEVTFDPSTGTVNMAGVKVIDSVQYATVQLVSCPSSTQCTAIDDSGDEVTFDPSRGTVNAAGVTRIATDQNLTSVSCPSSTQCTATDGNGDEVTFNPSRGTVNAAGVKRIDAAAVSCPSLTQCTAIDGSGDEVTFDPRSPAGAALAAIKGADSLNAVSCISVSECVTVDTVGDGFAGFSPAAFSLLSSTAPPTISGTGRQGKTLTESHGSYSGTLSSYSYQWEDCDPSGAGCAAIRGASAQTYTPSAVDVGHTVRVEETASNAGGSARPNVSAPTGLIVSASRGAVVLAQGKAFPVGTTFATLNGTIDTKGLVVTWQFDYGQRLPYDKATPVQTINAGDGVVRVSWKLLRLKPNTTYHFRLIARVSRAAGQTPLTTHGKDLKFTTRPAGADAADPTVRWYVTRNGPLTDPDRRTDAYVNFSFNFGLTRRRDRLTHVIFGISTNNGCDTNGNGQIATQVAPAGQPAWRLDAGGRLSLHTRVVDEDSSTGGMAPAGTLALTGRLLADGDIAGKLVYRGGGVDPGCHARATWRAIRQPLVDRWTGRGAEGDGVRFLVTEERRPRAGYFDFGTIAVRCPGAAQSSPHASDFGNSRLTVTRDSFSGLLVDSNNVEIIVAHVAARFTGRARAAGTVQLSIDEGDPHQDTIHCQSAVVPWTAHVTRRGILGPEP
ncbi:MAG: hypothetical protein ACYC91_19470, partial [Solirubrobacteraceae bacterium]